MPTPIGVNHSDVCPLSHERCAVRLMRQPRAPGKLVTGSAGRVFSLWPRPPSPSRPRLTGPIPSGAAFFAPGIFASLLGRP
jgi:hypothetical protein